MATTLCVCVEDFLSRLDTQEWNDHPALLYCRGPILCQPSDLDGAELDYFADKDKRHPYVGVDYGDHDVAHAIMNWLAKRLDKDVLVYDGQEEQPVPDDPLDFARWDLEHIHGPDREYLEQDQQERIARLTPVIELLERVWVDMHTR